MAVYTIQDTTLTDIADAIREKTGQVLEVEYPMTNNVANNISFDIVKDSLYRITIIPTELQNDGYGKLEIHWVDEASGTTYGGYVSVDTRYVVGEPTEFIITSPGNGTIIKIVNIKAVSDSKIVSATVKLAEVKEDGTLKNKYKPTEIANEIRELNIIPNERLILTGDMSFLNYYGSWDWYFTHYADKITTNNITSLASAFYQSRLPYLPFEINLNQPSKYQGCECSNAFAYMKITDIPTVNWYGKAGSLQSIFSNCQYLVHIPDDFWPDCALCDSSTAISGMFQSCYRLRHLPIGFINRLVATQTYYYGPLYNCASYCYSLDDIVGIKAPDTNWTSNGCYQMVHWNYRLKDCIFATNEDGSAVIRKWKSQALDFSNYVGYGSASQYGFSTATQIKDAETYELLKDHPDAWTSAIAYSRYNHDSAVRTINSLPDTSAYLATAGGTNTIKFKGSAGSATDGGAINTLTAEEIAVATAKGWTVSFT